MVEEKEVQMNQAVQVKNQFSAEDIQLIRDTVAKGATESEFKLFMMRCKLLGLNPLKPGLIHFVKYGNSPGTIVVGIEGFRAKANSTGKLNGVERELIRDASGKCIGAKGTVYRKDWDRPAIMEVSMAEYSTGNGPWKKMPETMIGKVAEAAALRMAFPDHLGGIYAEEEMHQAEEHRSRVAPEQPAAGDGGPAVPANGTFIKYGRFAGQYLGNIDPYDLRQWVLAEEAKAEKSGKSLSPFMQKLFAEAEPIIAAWEIDGEEYPDDFREFEEVPDGR